MPRLLMLCLVLVCTTAFAETYRWVDANGHTVFSDTPPSGKARHVVKTEDSAPASNLPFAVQLASKNYPVTLYTDQSCTTECSQARDLLKKRNVPFTEKVLRNPEDLEELKKLVGDAFVPSIKVGKQTQRGYQAGLYNNLLDLAGYPKSASPIPSPTPSPKPSAGSAPTP